MPKRQTTKKSKLPFAHPTKHGKLHWKKVLIIVLIGTFGLLIAAGITAQVIYNKFIWDRTAENGSLKITLLIQSALEGLEDLKSAPAQGPDGTQLIKEMRLSLPAETDNVRKLMYFYQAADAGTDGAGYNWNMPESVQITTKQLAGISRQRLLVGQTVDDIFSFVPEAQACNRGFVLQFTAGDDNGLTLSGTRRLQDGRTLYVYREPECKSHVYTVDQLEAYLLQAQSY